MRRDLDKNVNVVEEPEEEEEMVHTPMGTTTNKKETKPIKIGVHVKYEDEEYVVQDIKDEKIFIAMRDKEHTVNKADVEVIE